ncbi:hypothetical protein MLPF_1236 [Mycobacterium lepromatosis]|nr:hypothetical protein MLPF_1236 [Mycobacterium lepromatosis]
MPVQWGLRGVSRCGLGTVARCCSQWSFFCGVVVVVKAVIFAGKSGNSTFDYGPVLGV